MSRCRRFMLWAGLLVVTICVWAAIIASADIAIVWAIKEVEALAA